VLAVVLQFVPRVKFYDLETRKCSTADVNGRKRRSSDVETDMEVVKSLTSGLDSY
jgi:hypothetical protein